MKEQKNIYDEYRSSIGDRGKKPKSVFPIEEDPFIKMIHENIDKNRHMKFMFDCHLKYMEQWHTKAENELSGVV